MTLSYLTERPEEARWLRPKEREWLAGELENERKERASHVPAWHALGNRKSCCSQERSFWADGDVRISLWMPKIVEKLSYSACRKVSLIASIPYLVALPVMWLAGWSSDRTGERRWHSAIPRIVAGAALAACIYSADHVWISVLALSVAAAGFYSAHAGFWPMPNMLLGRTAAATSIGLINTIGSLGGFVGPYAIGYLRDRTGGFGASLLFLSLCSVASGLLVLCVSLPNYNVIRGAE